MDNFQDITRNCREALRQGQTREALDLLYDLHTQVSNELHQEIKQLVGRGRTEPLDTESTREAIDRDIERLLAACEGEHQREKS